MTDPDTPHTAAESRPDMLLADPANLSPEAIRRLLHDMQVQRIELETQNEELRQTQAELDAARERYFDLYDLAPVGYLTISEAGLIIEANLTAASLLAATRSALVRQPFSRFILTEDQDAYYLCRKRLFNEGGSHCCELRMVRTDATTFWARLESIVTREPDGALVSRLVISNISDGKQSEDALRRSEEKYRILHESMMDAFVSVALDGPILEFNRAYQEMLGYTKEELLKLTYIDLTPEKWHAFESRLVAEQIIPRGDSDLYEKEYRRKDGTVFPVELRAFLLRDTDGNPSGIWGIVRDITRRKHAEESLRKISERYRVTLAAAMDGFWFLDDEARLLEVNDAYCRMSGYSRDELVGRHIADVDASQSAEEIRSHHARVKAEGAIRFETRHRRKDGSLFDVEVSAQHQVDTEGGRYVVFLRDITLAKQEQDALRKSEALLNAIQHVSKVGGWMWDIEQEQMFWTEETYNIHGYQPGEVGSSMEEQNAKSLGLCDEADRPWIMATFRLCAEHGEPYDIEYPFTNAKGRRMWVRTAAHALREGSRIVKVVGNMIDITEQKIALDALRETNELLAEFIRVSPIYSYIKEVTTTGSRVLHASENYLDMIGIAGSDMVGRTMAELFPPEFAAKITADDQDIVGKGELLVVDEDFNGRNYTSLKFPLTLGGRALLGGYTIDITERKQAEQRLREWNTTLEQRVAERTLELQESEARFRLLADATFEGIAVNEGGIVKDCNLQLAAMYGYEPAEMIGRPVTDFVTPESLTVITKHLSSTNEAIYEFIGLRKDGSVFPGEVHVRMGMWMGQPTRISAQRDLTESKRAAARLRVLQAELMQAQRLALTSEISAGIIHQLGQPLSSIGANLSAMVKLKADGLQDIGVLDIVRDVESDVARMREIAAHLRALANPTQPNNRIIDINAIVSEALPLLRQKAETSGIIVATDFGEDLLAPRADAVQISQVILNLVSNAIDAVEGCPPERRRVTVATRASGANAVEVTVRDAGSGLSPETLALLFTPFFSTKPKGLGIGLRLSQTIIEAHGGSIEGSNNPDEVGATFRIVLPVLPPQ